MESFVFYKSFYESVKNFDDLTRLEVFDTICKYGLTGEEPNENISQISKVVFLMAKPQIDANTKRRQNGKKGGRPVKAEESKTLEITSGFEKENHRLLDEKPMVKPNVNVNVNVNENVNENENVNVNDNEVLKKEKNLDPFFDNSIIQEFQKYYLLNFNCKAFLSANQRQKIMELNSDIPDFKEAIPIALEKLKNVKFDIPNFTPTANWLLKDDNFTAVLNGAYDKTKDKFDLYREELARNGQT